ncbi:MAG: response regulator [Bacteroidota bacterium]
MANELLLLRDELAAQRAVVANLEQQNSDLEIELQAAIEHGDAIEAELAFANEQMRGEIAERIRAEVKLQRLLAALSEQKADLELIVHTITEHSDEIDVERELANEQLRLENERIRLAKEQAEELARAKTEFVAVVSHEVRTPMNGVLGMARLLLETPLTAEQRDMAETVVSSGRLLLNILDDLLDLSKIEAGRLEIEQIDFNLVQLVEEGFGLMSMRAAERGVALAQHVAADVPAMVVGDPMRLRQIVINLVGNAIKFTEKGSVTLTVEREQDGDGSPWLRFAVIDTGIGIGPEERTRLFNRYAQAAAWVSRKFGGTGLGLSICHQLVELMGGAIGVDSVPGQGSTFWFRVPLVAAFDAGRRAGPLHRPVRVLLVDEDVAVRRLLARRLDGWGVAVAEFDAAAAATAAPLPGDVLVVGARVPEAEARALAAARGVPAVILSQPGHLAPADDGGAIVMLAEPVREAALAGAFDWLLGPADGRIPVPSGPIGVAAVVSRPALPSLSVLLVEDNPVNRRVAVGMLERQGHRVTAVDNGALALEAVHATAYDFILMDRHMPVMDGVEAVRAIRALPPPAGNVPVVALTAAATQDEVLECLVAGMDDFVAKPITPEQLDEVARRVVAHRAGTAADGDRDFDPTLLEILRESLGAESVAELVPQYYATAQTLLTRLSAAIAMRDGKAVGDHAHDLKGASGQLGLVGLQRLCGAIEAAVREGRMDDAIALADQIPAAYARGRAWLRSG